MTVPSALSVMAGTLAMMFTPPLETVPSVWAADNLVVADGPRAGHRWDLALTPQLGPVLDALMNTTAWNQVVLRKSSQIGATGLGIAWLGAIICNAPAKAMVIFPTIGAVEDYNRQKLQPTIDASPELNKRVRNAVSRSAQKSTALNKIFPGGSIILTGANSSVDLRSKTVKFQHRDEIDDWPIDLDGQGDPEEMADARLISFHASGDYMVFKTSTPTIKGRSRIDEAFLRGDQRHWQVKCPHCGVEQKLIFGGKDRAVGLKFDGRPPYGAHYICASGCVIDHSEKADMVRGGRYVADNPNEGLYPSFHLDSLTSLLTTWDNIAERFVAAKDDTTKLKGFVNLWLGESWEDRGEAPEWKLLMMRREQFPRRVLPSGALLVTLSVDVQGNGLFYEVIGWGADKQSWSIDAGFIPGDTADNDAPVWKELTELALRKYPDGQGAEWGADLIGVDAGFNTEAVKAWVRRHPRAMALKGQPGWYLPPIGTPAKVDVTFGGQKRKRGVLIWPVGTWPLKAEFYALLRKDPPSGSAELYPAGFVHLTDHNDERYCRQIVAETLREREHRGRIMKEWERTGDNHFHDCRIYGMALFDHLGGNRFTADQWKAIAQQRGTKPEIVAVAVAVSAKAKTVKQETPGPVVNAPVAVQRRAARPRGFRSKGIS